MLRSLPEYSSFLLRISQDRVDALLRRASAGDAWHADHVVPVYKGGGLCDVENLRTLCVACHAEVTAQQARERGEERKKGKGAARRRAKVERPVLSD